MAILESGSQVLVGIGVVYDGYETQMMPGMGDGTVGYHTDGKVYDVDHCKHGRGTIGS